MMKIPKWFLWALLQAVTCVSILLVVAHLGDMYDKKQAVKHDLEMIEIQRPDNSIKGYTSIYVKSMAEVTGYQGATK